MIPALDTVDLRLLRVFQTVVECGGFSAAQVELNVSQSTISTQMAALEARLATRLCRRGRAGFGLTEDGQRVYEASQRLFNSIGAFQTEVADMGGLLVGELHIATIDNMVSNPDFRLIDAIGRFVDRAGSVHLNLHVASPLDIERAVLDGRYHVGIGTFPSRAPGLSFRRLFNEPMNLYCGRPHPLFGRADRTIGVAEVERAAYVRRGYAGRSRTGKFRPRNVAATAVNMEAIATMVLSGRFLGHLPDHYAARWVERGDMRALKPALLRFASTFDVITRTGPSPSGAVEVFLEALDGEYAMSGGVASQAPRPIAPRRRSP